MKRLGMTTAIIALVTAGAASAETAAKATTDLNLRMGPGPNYEIVTVIPGDGSVAVDGCIAESNWCQVSYDGQAGWVFGDYLLADVGGEMKVVTMEREVVQVPTVEYQEGKGAVEGAVFGAIVGGLIAGPIGIAATSAGIAAGVAAGAATGAVVGDAETPDYEGKIRTYVVENPVETVYYEGEVVTGARIGDGVEIYPIPNTQYSYLYINGTRAVISNDTRTVTYIAR